MPLELRHAWGQWDRPIPDLGEPVATFDHADGLGEVRLHKVGEVYWVTYPHRSVHHEDRGTLYRECCPYAEVANREFGKVKRVRCHTASPSHPWNEGKDMPGYHKCGACGYPTWIECHGVAAGGCERCGYHG